MRALDRRPRPQQRALMEQYWPISHMAKKDCSSRILILPQPHVSARSTANMARKAQSDLEVFDHALTCGDMSKEWSSSLWQRPASLAQRGRLLFLWTGRNATAYSDLDSGSVLSDFPVLTRLGKPVEVMYIPDGTHILEKPWDRMIPEQGDVGWFCFWLRNIEGPALGKAEQCKRRRQLRRIQEKDRTGHNNQVESDHSLGTRIGIPILPRMTLASGSGGAAGKGVATPGDIFAKIFSRRGLHLNAYNAYQCIIRGGHTFLT